jgi:hypothetical protein
MGATQTNMQAEPKIRKKLLDHQIYQSKKLCFVKICMGATRRNLHIQSTNQNENFPKKAYLVS